MSFLSLLFFFSFWDTFFLATSWSKIHAKVKLGPATLSAASWYGKHTCYFMTLNWSRWCFVSWLMIHIRIIGVSEGISTELWATLRSLGGSWTVWCQPWPRTIRVVVPQLSEDGWIRKKKLKQMSEQRMFRASNTRSVCMFSLWVIAKLRDIKLSKIVWDKRLQVNCFCVQNSCF